MRPMPITQMNQQNYPLPIAKERDNQVDIESICSELYKCTPNNREMFNAVMNDLKEEVFGDDLGMSIKPLQVQVKSLNDFAQYRHSQNNMYNVNNKSQVQQHQQQQQQQFPSNAYQQPQRFIPSVPEGEMINIKPYKNNIMHKKYTDVHANSKFYYPSGIDEGNNMAMDTQWTNKTNNIMMMTSQQNNNNWQQSSSNNNIRKNDYDNYQMDNLPMNNMNMNMNRFNLK